MREPVLPDGVPQPLNPELLAWAAGFFDGEGSTFAKNEKRRPDYWQLQISVPQSGEGRTPEVLERFRTAALGTGRIDPPNEEGVYAWRARGRVDAELALALMWPYLGTVKRSQALAALTKVDAQYVSGVVKKRPPRYRPTLAPHPQVVAPQSAVELDLAWAAGFLDAEGWFGVVHGRPRKDATPTFRIRVSAPQHSHDGKEPEVLTRLRAVLGIGTIERHGEADDFKWVAYGPDAVATVLALTRSWLGAVKLAQADEAFDKWSAQPRVRSRSDFTCARGHVYDGVLLTASGRIRKYCNACARMAERARRAARGGKPRTVRLAADDSSRVYRVHKLSGRGGRT